MNKLKVIVAGSRSFNDWNFANVILCDVLKKHLPDVEIVDGRCLSGGDQAGRRFAIDHGLKIKPFPADWDAHGKAAGYVRNKEMAIYADWAVVFWDGRSKGSKHMIDLAQQYCQKTVIVYYLENRLVCKEGIDMWS